MTSPLHGANDSADAARAVAVTFANDALVVDIDDGRTVSAPLEWFPSLRAATPAQRANFRLIGGGIGIHWPDLDEDLSVKGLLQPSHVRHYGETG